MNLEIRTERLTNSVMSMCETLCSQHEICIQMLERRDYQTVYKVMKKEQRISRMVEMINHQVMELMPLVQPVPAAPAARLFSYLVRTASHERQCPGCGRIRRQL